MDKSDAPLSPPVSLGEIDGLAQRIDRPVVLVGLMGVGKTSVGKRLSAALRCPFIDADEEIETVVKDVVQSLAQHVSARLR